MRVTLYVPQRMFGFAKDPDSEAQVFFHLGDFRWGDGPPLPPPVIGEWVEAEYDPEVPHHGTAPKARRVTRVQNPVFLEGVIDHFKKDQGYGFITGSDRKSYYLHRSDVEDNLLPTVGETVEFFAGYKRGKPRACYCALKR